MTPEIEWVYNIWKASGVPMKRFAQICGLAPNCVYGWFKKGRGISPKSLTIVGNTYGVTPPEDIMQAAMKATKSRKGRKKVDPEDFEPVGKRNPGGMHWQHDGVFREFCKRKHCQWTDSNGVCTWGHCMRED